MNDGNLTNPSLDRSEHIDENISAKRVAPYNWDGTNWQRSPVSFVDVAYDYVGVDTSGSTADVYTFYRGGSGGTRVRTITLAYADATKAALTSVTRT